MKQIYRCDFCSQMGTAEEIMEHEEKCIWNYHRKSCRTCKHREMQTFARYKCMFGVEIPEHHIIEHCSKWEWDERDCSKLSMNNIFNPFIGL